jgi:3-methyl-2-oxobutanoate hydroxymethyltransferase
MEAVKIEGGKDVLPLVTRLVDIGVPVMGHVGLTPQRVSALSGFRIQGKTAESALRIVQDSRALQAAGAFAILLEAVPAPVADFMAKDLKIPIIGAVLPAQYHASAASTDRTFTQASERHPRAADKFSSSPTCSASPLASPNSARRTPTSERLSRKR